MNQLIGPAIVMAFLLCACMAECPPDDAVVKVDPRKLSGEWFVVASIIPQGQPRTKCGHAVVTSPSPSTVNMEYKAIKIRDETPSVFLVNATVNDDFVGTWVLQQPLTQLGTFNLRVISVEYDSHLIMIGCDDEYNIIFMMIWSRTKTLPLDILCGLKTEAGRYVNVADIQDVDQTC